MPNQNGNVYGLTILSPIINAPDGDVSHDCAIRYYLASSRATTAARSPKSPALTWRAWW